MAAPEPPPCARRVRAYYRAVVIETGRLWCESRSSLDVAESLATAPGPVATEVCYVYELDGPWLPWTPPIDPA